MPRLFMTPREINLFKDLAKEVVKDVVGQKIYLVCPESIADAIITIKRNSNLRNDLRHLGYENAKKYSWATLRKTMVKLVENYGEDTARSK